MKRINGYQTTDGRVFTAEQKQEARDHQRSIDMNDQLDSISQRFESDPYYFCDDFGCNVILTAQQLTDFIKGNAEDIKLALAGKFVIPTIPEAPVVEVVEVIDQYAVA